jgi:hypothetical protein
MAESLEYHTVGTIPKSKKKIQIAEITAMIATLG